MFLMLFGQATWVPLNTAWCVLGLRMEETAFRYGGFERGANNSSP